MQAPPDAEMLQIEVLNGKVDDVAAHREIQMIGIDDSTPNRIGVIVRQRNDSLTVQPTAALDANARENLRILTNFASVMYPVSGRWKGQKAVRGKDLSCGGVAFYTAVPLEEREIVEIVLPVTDEPLVVKTQVIRIVQESGGLPLYAAKFVDLIHDEEALIRKAVFSIQIRTSN